MPSSWWCSNELTSRSSFSKDIYGGDWAKYNNCIIKWYIIMKKICRWHYLFYKVNFHQQSTWDYHKDIKFNIQTKTENKVSFLHVLLICNNSMITTKEYRKNKNTDVYINWKSFAPNNWRCGPLKILVTRAFDICSTDKYLKE